MVEASDGSNGSQIAEIVCKTGEKIVVAGLTALTGIVVLGIVAYHNERKLKDIK